MAVAHGAPPTRLIVCVDGESNSSSGLSKQQTSQTNIQRIHSGVARGNCTNATTGQTFNQVVQYWSGIGSADDVVSKDRLTIGGPSHAKQIQDVFESCSRLNGSQDEVWLFGFSRGAYVVRAVVGLLNNFGALASAGQPEFEKDYKKLLKEADRYAGTSTLSLTLVST
jgi:uncharacterized protein (DUF2235 family)